MIKKIVFWAILNLIFCKINYEKIFKERREIKEYNYG